MVSVVDGLERLGLVDRARDPADRRKYAIGITDEGLDLLHRELAPAMLKSLDVFLSPLAPEEREQFQKLLWRVVYDRAPQEGDEGEYELEPVHRTEDRLDERWG
jgi:DNA-binding MarR family transcriptional regulator